MSVVSPSSTLTRDVQIVHHTLNIGTRRQPQPRVLEPSQTRSINPHIAHHTSYSTRNWKDNPWPPSCVQVLTEVMDEETGEWRNETTYIRTELRMNPHYILWVATCHPLCRLCLTILQLRTYIFIFMYVSLTHVAFIHVSMCFLLYLVRVEVNKLILFCHRFIWLVSEGRYVVDKIKWWYI